MQPENPVNTLNVNTTMPFFSTSSRWCGEGKTLSERNSCDYVDECIWAPCLHGAACLNTNAGYSCSCPPGFTGRHCQLSDAEASSMSLSVGAMTALLAWCFMLLVLCAILIHHQHRRSSSNKGRGRADGKENDVTTTRDQSSPAGERGLTPNLLELKRVRPPDINGGAAWTKHPNVAHVDVLQVEPLRNSGMYKETSLEEGKARESNPVRTGNGVNANGIKREPNGTLSESNGNLPGRDHNSTAEDLRNYAYEGDGSSPGSLSSCLESCSGSFKFLGGFRDVAQLLESCDFQSSNSAQNETAPENPATNSLGRNIIKVKQAQSISERSSSDGRGAEEMTPVDEIFMPHIDSSLTLSTGFPLQKLANGSKDGSSLSRKELKQEKVSDYRTQVFSTPGSSNLPEAPVEFRNN